MLLQGRPASCSATMPSPYRALVAGQPYSYLRNGPLREARQPREYDHAVELLQDLWDLAQRTGSGEDVARRIREVRERHRSKRTLLQRLDRAGLPK
jgi:hypothetical protein